MNQKARIVAAMVALALAAAACGNVEVGTTTDGTDSGDTESGDTTEDTDSGDTESDDTTEDTESDDTESDDTMEDTESDDSMEGGSASALAIVSIDFDAGEVVIANNGDAEVDLDGYFLCNFPSYAPISGVGAVAPGATVTVPIPVDVSPAAGELGLYTTDTYSSPDAIQAYVEWGSADHERSPVAQEAGIWDGVPLTVEGNVLTVG